MGRVLILLLVVMGAALPSVVAQTEGSSICVVAFADVNENSIRDTTELPFPGIHIALAVQEQVIVQSHITTSEVEPHCFEGLPAGTYTLFFSESSNHRPTTKNEAVFELDGIQRLRVEFGAVESDPFQEEAERAPVEVKAVSRLAVGAIAAFITIATMTGLGLVIAAFIR